MPNRDMTLIRFDSFVTKTYNFMKSIDPLKIEIRKTIEKNKELYSEENDMCFVLACGPSINGVDLNKIIKYPTITVNCFHQGAENFNSKYHLFFDPAFQTDFLSGYVSSFTEKYPDTKIIMKYDKKVTKTINENYYYIDAKYVDDGRIKYDMTKSMTGSINVVPVAIECALSMGYKRIILLGCDFSMYTQIKNQHFYDTELNEHNTVDVRDNIELNNVGNLIRCAFVHKQHYEINQMAKKMGVQILNATDGSLIDAYDSIEYEKLEKEL